MLKSEMVSVTPMLRSLVEDEVGDGSHKIDPIVHLMLLVDVPLMSLMVMCTKHLVVHVDQYLLKGKCEVVNCDAEPPNDEEVGEDGLMMSSLLRLVVDGPQNRGGSCYHVKIYGVFRILKS